jgi:hypothetical protein
MPFIWFLLPIIGSAIAGGISLRYARRSMRARIGAYLVTAAVVISTYIVIKILDRFVFGVSATAAPPGIWLSKVFAIAWVFQTIYLVLYYWQYVRWGRKTFWLWKILLPPRDDPGIAALVIVNVGLGLCTLYFALF